MTAHPSEDRRTPREEAIFITHMARLDARMAKAMAAQERAMAAAERRIAEAMRRQERAMEAAERRLSRAMRLPNQPMDPMEFLRVMKGRRKPPARPHGRGMEGGDDVPAVPNPKPKPLAGAAAAPIE